MLKLNKEFYAQVEALREKQAEWNEILQDLYDSIDTAHADIRMGIQEYNTLVQDFNDKIEECREDVQACAQNIVEIKDNFQSEWEDRSEKWQESEKGDAAIQWIEELEGYLGELDADMVDEIEELDEPECPDFTWQTDIEDVCTNLENHAEKPE